MQKTNYTIFIHQDVAAR